MRATTERNVDRGFSRLVHAFVVWVLVFGCGNAAMGYERQKSILLLYADRSDMRGNIVVDRTIRSVLDEALDLRLDLHTEYIDVSPVSDDDSFALRDFFVSKYATQRFDVIVAVGSNALRFLRDYGTETFPNVPIVSWGGRNVLDRWGAGPPITGVVVSRETDTMKSRLEFIRRLQPDLERLVVISGASQVDRSWAEIAKRDLEEYESAIAVVYLAGLPVEDLLNRVTNLPKNTAVLCLTVTEDGAGRRLLTNDVTSRIVQVAAAPVYALYAANLESGIVGGLLVDQEAIARGTAGMVLRLLRGEQIHDIPIQESPLVPMVNWPELQRWGISETRLPQGITVVNKGPSLWDTNKFSLVGIVSLCIVQMALIVTLLVQRVMRKRAENAMRESEQRYRNVLETQTELICRFLPDTTLTFVNDAYCRYFGKSRRELVGMKFKDLIPEVDRDRAIRHIQSVAAQACSNTHEHQVVRPDGTFGWQEWTNHVVLDSSGQVVELQGIGRDVTQQKLAEESAARTQELLQSSIDALYAHLALLDERCNIIAVNESWRQFAQANGYTGGVGLNYLEVCESSMGYEETCLVSEGIRALMRNERHYFNLVYESSRGDAKTWFQVRVNRFYSHGVQRFVVVHEDITEIKRAHDSQQQLAGLLLRTQDEERKRIARDLHDITVQNVAIIKADLTRTRKGWQNLDSQAQEALCEGIALCDNVISELRTLCYLLHPPFLDELGLVAALQWYVRGFIERCGIQVEVLVMHEIGRLPTETEMTLFYVAQESLTNIHRHSGSRYAIIWIKKEEGEVELRIQDEGRGTWSKDSGRMVPGPGVGILSMRQRLKQLGGQLEIESDSGGTIVTARTPILRNSYAAHSNSR